MDELAVEGARTLVDGLKSAEWKRVRDRFAEWFVLRGQDEWAHELRSLQGPLRPYAWPGNLEWRFRLSEGLADAWDLDGSDELASLIREFDVPARPEEPTPAPAPAAPGDRFDFQGITVNGQFVGVQHVQQEPAAARPGSVDWPSAEDMAPLAYGVRPTRRGKGLPQLPPYVERDADSEVNSAVETAASEGGLVVVQGEAYVGKSRTALAAMAHVLPGVRVFAPARHENLRGLPALLRGMPGERCALWLDDLDGHLGADGLEPRLLAQLAAQGVPVIATMREDTYDKFRRLSRGRVLDLAQIVELPRDWSQGERKRAGETEDPRLTDAARRCGVEGVAAYVAVGPMLWEEWQRARRADRHPRGYALVRAAVDLARCGLRGPLPQDLLVRVHEAYEAVAGLERESVDDALAWAAEKRDGVLRMLRRSGASMWEASPYLVDAASQDETFQAVDLRVWTIALGMARADSAYDVEVVEAGARGAFRAAAEAGDGRAMFELGELEEDLGEKGEAEKWFRRAAEIGHVEAAGRLGRLLAERGEQKEAVPFLEVAAGGGASWAALELGQIHSNRTEHWLREAAEAGDMEAAHRLGELHMGKAGGESEAMRWCLKANEAGVTSAAVSIGRLHQSEGDLLEAEKWYRQASDAGDPQGMRYLGLLLRRRGGDSEAEGTALLRKAARAGRPRRGAVHREAEG
ncbi:tetratricopeptide repeat protein [Streptomyces adonidis]|uniref:Sel1 repeat family protein n=1 Tax=Streptomyces sp. NBC_00093 TaxID=2975649 RepID=A0AAU2A4B7_9ACTN